MPLSKFDYFNSGRIPLDFTVMYLCCAGYTSLVRRERKLSVELVEGRGLSGIVG